MKLTVDFKNPELAKSLIDKISAEVFDEKSYNIMEICGTHTVSIFRYGIRSVLPENVNLLSGPGCPVCVTSQGEIDAIFEILAKTDICVLTFGDLMRVPGSRGESLEDMQSEGYDIRVVLSPLDAVDIAEKEPDRNFVLVGIGFETTAPAIAASVVSAEERSLRNFYLLAYNKTMPEVIKFLLNDSKLNVDGFLCPGHVSVVTGEEIYFSLPENNKAAVIAGFEPVDILSSILYIIYQINRNEFKVYNNYSRAVRREGNIKAKKLLEEVFVKCTASWRGIGQLKNSGLCLNKKYEHFDALKVFDVDPRPAIAKEGCRCGEVLKGYILPKECSMFGNGCTPEKPFGPCMVSTEGACAAYFKYSS